MLVLSSELLRELQHHGSQCYPEECCGLLLGQQQQDDRYVTELWSTANTWSSDFMASDSDVNLVTRPDASRRNRFAIAPIELVRAQKYARTHQLTILGIYHSHPDHPAIPSEYDRQIAWETYSYVIMSVTSEEIVATRSWKLDGDRQFLEEDILFK